MFLRLTASLWRRGYPRLPGAVILRYHRIADLPTDPNAIAVSPERFRAHMEILRRDYRPVALGAMVRLLEERRLEPRSVVVTFDDGYADNLYRAHPVLEQYEIPATVFVTTRYVQERREFWWDALERALLHPGELPGPLTLRVDGRELRWEMGPSARYDESDFLRHRSWTWRSRRDPTPRHGLFRELSNLLRPLPDEKRQPVVRDLLEWAGVSPAVRNGYGALSGEELTRLADGGLVTVGAHTMTHPVLSRLSETEQWNEIRGSKRFLESVLGQEVDHFAYPYGVIGKTLRKVRDAGFRSACGTAPGVVFSSRRPHRLPRLYAGNIDGEGFERSMATVGTSGAGAHSGGGRQSS